MARPKVDLTCVASHYQAPNERILEISHALGGGLISIRATTTGRLVIDVYELDDTVEVNIAPTRRVTGRVPTPHPGSYAPPETTVLDVADLYRMTGDAPTRGELSDLRSALASSSVGDVLGAVFAAVTDRHRRRIVDDTREFGDADAFHGCLASAPLATVPVATVEAALTGIATATGLVVVRVVCDDDARLCVEHPSTGRLFEIGDHLDAWLRGDLDSPGPCGDWIGDPVEDIDRDQLVARGAHDYLLPTATT